MMGKAWWHGSGNMRQLITLCLEGGNGKRWMLEHHLICPIYSFWDPSPWDGVSYIQHLTSSVNTFWDHHRRPTKRHISRVILNPVQLIALTITILYLLRITLLAPKIAFSFHNAKYISSSVKVPIVFNSSKIIQNV